MKTRILSLFMIISVTFVGYLSSLQPAFARSRCVAGESIEAKFEHVTEHTKDILEAIAILRLFEQQTLPDLHIDPSMNHVALALAGIRITDAKSGEIIMDTRGNPAASVLKRKGMERDFAEKMVDEFKSGQEVREMELIEGGIELKIDVQARDMPRSFEVRTEEVIDPLFDKAGEIQRQERDQNISSHFTDPMHLLMAALYSHNPISDFFKIREESQPAPTLWQRISNFWRSESRNELAFNESMVDSWINKEIRPKVSQVRGQENGKDKGPDSENPTYPEGQDGLRVRPAFSSVRRANSITSLRGLQEINSEYVKAHFQNTVIDKNMLREIVNVLFTGNPNVLVTGENGMGKGDSLDAFIKAVVDVIDAKKSGRESEYQDIIPREIIENATFVQLENGGLGLIAGTKYRGTFEERVKDVTDSVQQHDGTVFFVIKNLDQVLERGGSSDNNTNTIESALLFPLLENASSRETMQTALQRHQRVHILATMHEGNNLIKFRDGNIFRSHFTEIPIQIHGDHRRQVLTNYMINKLPEGNQRPFSDSQLESIIDRVIELGTPETIPHTEHYHKDIKILDTILQMIREREVSRINDPSLLVDEALAKILNRPVGRSITTDFQRAVEVITIVEQSIKNQSEQIALLVKEIYASFTERSLPRINNTHPINVIAISGTAGIGKTMTIRLLGREMGIEVVTFTGSAFKDGDLSLLNDAKNPDSLASLVTNNSPIIVYFNEANRGNQRFTDTLETIMDGSFKDSAGKTVSFSNAIIIVDGNPIKNNNTDIFSGLSNKFSSESLSPEMKFKESFVESFQSRIGEPIVFNPLNRPTARNIVDIILKDIETNKTNSITKLEISEQAREVIVDYIMRNVEVEGARPINNVLSHIAHTAGFFLMNDLRIQELSLSENKEGDNFTKNVDQFDVFIDIRLSSNTFGPVTPVNMRELLSQIVIEMTVTSKNKELPTETFTRNIEDALSNENNGQLRLDFDAPIP